MVTRGKSKPDVLIVGGGPAGAIAAEVAAAGGADALLIDKKSDLGSSSACGGLVSLETWDRLGGKEETVLNEISGVVVHPPAGSQFELSAPGTRAYVIDRDGLNVDLLSRAKGEGVVVRPSTEIYSREGSKVKIKLVNGSEVETLEPGIVIGADGPQSDVRRLFNLESPSKLLYAIQAEKKYKPQSSDFVEVFFGKDIAPGFFAWIIPVSEEKARIGLATTQGDKLKQFFSRLLGKTGQEMPDDFHTGVIPMGVPDHSCDEAVLTVGDAAGQVKPTTGGGLYPISITSKLAGRVAVKALAGLENPSGYYYDKWMSEVGDGLRRELLLHKVLKRVSDKKLAKLLQLLKDPKISNWVGDNGDIDHLYPLAKRMARNPSILGTILKALPGEIASELMNELR
ncbi:MAG: NAD(P)/FAD-dependent oxidoreductase [Candidatus Bipolaricaulota bacterium]